MVNDNYKEYTRLEINDEDKRKFFKVHIGNEFGIAIRDKNNNFHMRVITAKAEKEINIKDSNDFYIWTDISGNHRGIFLIIFYEDEFIMHQWYRYGNSDVYYYEEKALTNQFVQQNNVQYI